MQLRQPHAFGVLNHHQRRARHVHSDLDYRRRDQQMQSAAFEIGHDLCLVASAHASVHQADVELGQRSREHGVSIQRGLQLQLLGFFDQRTYPVDLLARTAAFAHQLDHLLAPAVGKQLGYHRAAPRRQLINHRHIEIGVIAHGQRARDRRGTHHQLMGLAALLAQRQTLSDAETVLLIDDGKPEIGKLHLLLKQRVRSRCKLRLARYQPRHCGLFVFFGQASCQPRHLDAEGCKPLPELVIMLLSQNFCRRHEYRLIPMSDGLRSGERCNHRLAAAHIALQQALHRVTGGQVGSNFRPYAQLRSGEPKRQGILQLFHQRHRFRQFGRVLRTPGIARQAQRQLLRQQFVELDAPPRRMGTVFKLNRRDIGRRMVQGVHTAGEIRQIKTTAQAIRQRVSQIRLRQRGTDMFAEQRLRHPCSRRVNRSETVRQRYFRTDCAVTGMHHLQSKKTAAHFTQCTDQITLGKLFHLATVKIDEAQVKFGAAVVANTRNQRTTRLVLGLAMGHHTLYLDSAARQCLRNGGEPGLIFIAQRQMQDQICRAMQSQLGERRGQRAGCRQGFDATCRFGGCSQSVQHHYPVGLDIGVAWQCCHAHCSTRRVGFAEIFRHDLVDLGKVTQVSQKHIELDHISQTAARSFGHRLEVLEYTMNLRLSACNHLHGSWVEPDLAGQINGIAHFHRLRVSTNRGRCSVGTDDVFAHVRSCRV